MRELLKYILNVVMRDNIAICHRRNEGNNIVHGIDVAIYFGQAFDGRESACLPLVIQTWVFSNTTKVLVSDESLIKQVK